MKVISLKQTCEACPSQWEGTLEDGRMIYIRYRGGSLTADVSKMATDIIGDAINGVCIYEEIIGDNMDGFMTTSRMVAYLGGVLDFRFIKEV